MSATLSPSYIIDNHTYANDEFGVIHQLNPHIIPYTADYLAQHTAKPDYYVNSTRLNHLRLGLIYATLGRPPRTLCDFGCGDCSFISTIRPLTQITYGIDINPHTPFPADCVRVSAPPRAELFTFWDSLEHLPDLTLLATLPARYLLVSVPDHLGHDFATWKHRRPNEHLHHFTPSSLIGLLDSYGWTTLWEGHPEDSVRGTLAGLPNILTAAFTRLEPTDGHS